MYGIFTYIWLIFMVNVGEYTIHGSYGNNSVKQKTTPLKFTPRKTNECPLKINGWKMYFLVKYFLLRGHVSFRGCKTLRPRKKWCWEVGRQEKILLEVGNFSMLNFRRGSQIESGFRSKFHPGFSH